MSAITDPASAKYRAVHISGRRDTKIIKYACVHTTEGDTAIGAAQWFANPHSGGSANMVVDDYEAFRTVDDDLIPWAVPNLNMEGWHLEFAGYAHWTEVEWLDHKPMLKRGAYKTALRCRKYGILARWVGPLGLRLGRSGITTHRAGSFAWPLLARKFGFHTDPGKNFPRAYFLSLVKGYLAGL